MEKNNLIKSRFIFLQPIAILLFSISICIYHIKLSSPNIYIFPFILIFFIGIYIFIKALIYFLYTDVKIINNNSIIIKSGIINTKENNILFDKISNIEINKNIFGNIFGFGSIYINYTSGHSFNLDFIKNPETIKRNILSYKES